MQVEGVDLPVAANIIDEFDESVDPEDGGDDQDGDKGAVFLNPSGRTQRGGETVDTSSWPTCYYPEGFEEAESMFLRFYREVSDSTYSRGWEWGGSYLALQTWAGRKASGRVTLMGSLG